MNDGIKRHLRHPHPNLRRYEPTIGLPSLPPDYRRLPYGIVVSAFDCLHAGHILMLQDAKRRCDFLFAGLHTDPSTAPVEYRGKKKEKPVQNLEMRFIQLAALPYTDDIFVYESEEDLLESVKAIAELGPHIRVLGSDWRGKVVTGQELAAEVYYHERNHDWSSSFMRRELLTRALAEQKAAA